MRCHLRAFGPLLLALFFAVTVQTLVPSTVNAQQQEEDVPDRRNRLLRAGGLGESLWIHW